jgi:hypothetical protein
MTSHLDFARKKEGKNGGKPGGFSGFLFLCLTDATYFAGASTALQMRSKPRLA